MQQLFPKTTKPVQKFDPAVNTVWYATCPVGHYTLENLSHDMTSRARINPLMTNHCIRATSITVLSAANVERRHIKAITGHKVKQASKFTATSRISSSSKLYRTPYPISSKITIEILLQPLLTKFFLLLRVLPWLEMFTSTEWAKMEVNSSLTEWLQVAHFTTAVLLSI